MLSHEFDLFLGEKMMKWKKTRLGQTGLTVVEHHYGF